MTAVDIIADMQAGIRKVNAGDHLRLQMTAAGFDPDRGGLLILPESWRRAFAADGLTPPAYVRFSPYITAAVMVQDPAFNFPEPK